MGAAQRYIVTVLDAKTAESFEGIERIEWIEGHERATVEREGSTLYLNTGDHIAIKATPQ